MTHRERALAVLRYESYDRLPLVHFGYWSETLKKWVDEGHISEALYKAHGDGNPADYELNELYTARESELIQQYLAEHGEMPSGEDDLDDLF